MYSQRLEGRCPCIKLPRRQRGISKCEDEEVFLPSSVLIFLDIFSLITSLYCFSIFYDHVAGGDLMHIGFLAYLLSILSSIASFAALSAEDVFYDLRILTDYATQVLVIPSLTIELWTQRGIGSSEVTLISLALGGMAFLFFVAMEYKRRDITDLVVLLNVIFIVLANLACTEDRLLLYSLTAYIIFAVAYVATKRHSSDNPTLDNIFHVAMSIVLLLTLIDLEPSSYKPTPINWLVGEDQ
ncbi:unnamed protein product [Acanthoscelides obtectus]|uniref:Uncharacterized protein n=1 Tax=Acanthoscelides obtectus TaxID=200917 RepID=A0A9P0MA78_ACAOB|nr:unnamed protein product [Acanthoscelides obtectus]CAK1630720.1 hypothetical protein AOBTE_LOCUS6516 [Acanthoscelides obtectus]